MSAFAIGAGMAMGGATTALQAHYGAKAAKKDRRFNKKEAKKQRDFQERMSSTAVQRSVDDMRAAGINPIMAVSPGGGASTPQGSSARSVGRENISRDAIAAGVSTAKAAIDQRMGNQQLKNLKEQEKLTWEQKHVENARRLKVGKETQLIMTNERIARNKEHEAIAESQFWNSAVGRFTKKAELMGNAGRQWTGMLRDAGTAVGAARLGKITRPKTIKQYRNPLYNKDGKGNTFNRRKN